VVKDERRRTIRTTFSLYGFGIQRHTEERKTKKDSMVKGVTMMLQQAINKAIDREKAEGLKEALIPIMRYDYLNNGKCFSRS